MIAIACRSVVACAALLVAPCALAVVSCTVASNGVAFGSYDPSALVSNKSAGNIDVSCSGTLLQVVPFAVALSTGNGTYATRRLTNGASGLDYNLYIDPAYLVRWGDGSFGSQVASASLTLAVSPTLKSLVVYGQIPAGQTTAIVGSYTDSVIVTVSF